jgi:hypothetical protein
LNRSADTSRISAHLCTKLPNFYTKNMESGILRA